MPKPGRPTAPPPRRGQEVTSREDTESGKTHQNRPFKTAFYKAKKKKLKTFTFGGKVYKV